jgi:hypothetical protein
MGGGTYSFCPRIDIKGPRIKRANKSTFRTKLLLLQQGRITEFLRSTGGKNPQQRRASGVFSPSTKARPHHPCSLEVCRE